MGKEIHSNYILPIKLFLSCGRKTDGGVSEDVSIWILNSNCRDRENTNRNTNKDKNANRK